MMVQSSLSSSISSPLCFVLDHGKQLNSVDLLDWHDCGETRHKSSMFDDCHCEECKNSVSARKGKENDVVSDPIFLSKTYSNPSLIKDMSETCVLNCNDHVHKRRKTYDNFIDISSPPSGCDGVKASISLEEACKIDMVDKENATICRQHHQEDPGDLKMQIVDTRCANIVSKTKSIKRVLPLMKDESDKSRECSTLEMSKKSTDKSCLEKISYDSTRTIDSLDISNVDENVSCSQICKLCGLLDSTLEMLICDLCEYAFHMSCCNPKVRKVPVDEWHCRPCKKKKPKPLMGTATLIKPDIISEMAGYKKEELSIMSMLRDTEPYTTGVRIGRAFQADVPEWTGPISKTPLLEVQTDVWDRSSSMFLDPVHFDYVEPQLRPRHRLNYIKDVGPH